MFPLLIVSAWLYYPFAFDGTVLCVWRTIFNIECLTCGLTRATCALVHGELRIALENNRLVLVIVPGLFIFSLLSAIKLLKEKDKRY